MMPLATLLCAPALSSLADPTGQRVRTLQLALTGVVFTFIALGQAKTFWGVAAVLLLLAIARSPVLALADSLIVRLANRHNVPFGNLRLVGALGFAIFSICCGLLWQRWGYSPMFWVTALLFIPTVVLATGLDAVETVQPIVQRVPLRTILQDRALVTLLVATWLMGIPLGAAIIFEGIIMDALGGGQWLIGVFLGVIGFCEIPGMRLSGGLIKRLGGRQTLLLAYLLFGGAFAGYALASSPTMLILYFAVAAIFLINGTLLANWIARIPDVKGALNLNESQLGIALLFMAAGALVAQIASGWLIGRLGSRTVTIATALLFCLAAFWPGQATSLPMLMGALFLFGAFNGGLDVAMNAQAALVEGAYGKPIMASFHGLWSVGGLAGAVLGGLMASWGIGVISHLFGAGTVALILMWLATCGLIVDAGSSGGAGPAFALPPRTLLPMGAIAFAVLFCEGAVADWSAVDLRDTLQSAPGVAAAGYAAFALLMAGGRLTGDWLTVRLGPTRLVRGGGLLVVLGIGLIVIAPMPWLAIAGFGLIGAGVACIFPLILSAAAQTPGVIPGTAIAAMATAGYTGFLVGPPLLGFVAQGLSLRIALGLLGIFGLLIWYFGAAVGRAKHSA